VLVAFIPALGTPLVWGPVCIYLWVQGEIWQSLILAAFGALVLGSVAGVLRPMLLKGSAQIHPLWSLLAVLGGMFAFGALGLLVGPLILSLGLSALSIYEVELLHDRPPAGAERGGQTGETTAEPRSESSEAMT
jgi:predicted PurR-regulated permease PerM